MIEHILIGRKKSKKKKVKGKHIVTDFRNIDLFVNTFQFMSQLVKVATDIPSKHCIILEYQ